MITKGNRVLPQEGYLCKNQIKLDNKQNKNQKIITLIKGREKTYYIPADKYVRYDDKRSKARESNMKNINKKIENRTIGDQITFNDEWPKPKRRKIIRVMFHNVAGFSASDNSYESHLYNQDLISYQSDITCLTELNLNLNNNKMKNSIFNMFKFTDRHAKVQLASQPENLKSARDYYPGGNLIACQGTIAGRIIRKGSDEVGRWAWMELRCKDMKNIIVISAYRSNGNTSGDITIASQEMRSHMKNKKKYPHLVRNHFINDLSNFIDEQHKDEKLVLLMMDANEDVGSKIIQNFSMKLGLKNIHLDRLNLQEPPNTFIRGTNCIDMALGSIELLPCIQSVGYLPFESIGSSDHRPIFVDLNWEYLFSNMREDHSKPNVRSLTTKKRNVLDKYIVTLKQLFKKASLGEKLHDLKLDFERCGKPNAHLIKRMNKYDRTRKELMICALKKCSPSYGHKKWSPRMKDVGTRLRAVKKAIQKTKDDDPNKKQLQQELDELNKEWGIIQFSHHDLRLKHLEDLAETAAERQNLDQSKALKCIIKTEQIREIHRKHKLIFKKKQQGLKSILIQDQEIENEWIEVHDEDKVFNELIKITKSKLTKSAERCPMMKEPLLSKVGLFSETQFARDIIEGNEVEIPEIEYLDEQENMMLKQLIQSFSRPKNQNGTIEDLEWEYGPTQYRETFSKIRENIATGPSGLTMPVWKAACFDEELAEINAILIELPFKFGFTLERWKHVIHTMIPKSEKPYINKLRNIQITEADYNGALKYIIGRQLRKYCENNGTSSDNTFGGRSEKNCIQMLKTIQSINEENRIKQIPQAHLDIDAVGCFDNMATNMIGLAIQRIGGDRNVAMTQTKSLVQQKHRVKTTLGISPEYFTWNDNEKIGGSGQGSGASMINWHSFNEAIIESYRKLMNINKNNYEKEYHVKSFVDDNKLLFDFEGETTLDQIKDTLKRGIHIWNKLLYFTGGELSMPKCFFSVVMYQQNNDGRTRIVRHNKEDQELGIQLLDEKQYIQYVAPSEGAKLLGVRMSTSGDFHDEYKFRVQQSYEMAAILERTKLSRVESNLVYKVRFKPRLHYPLAVTTFNDKQADEIERPFINAVLPKLGFNRKMPRVVVFGPKSMGGVGLTKISYDQIIKHIGIIMKHITYGDRLGKYFEKSMITYQLSIGCGNNFLKKNPKIYFYKPEPKTNSISYLWCKAWEYDIEINISKLENSMPGHDRDRAIMDLVLQKKEEHRGTENHITDTQVRLINRCRLFCGVTWISEIVDDMIEMKIRDDMYDINQHTKKEEYPYITNISRYMWRQWIHLLYKITDKDNKIPKEYIREYSKTESFGIYKGNVKRNNFGEVIDNLKPELKQVVGEMKYEDDTVGNIAYKLRLNQEVSAWSDGSMMKGKNGHGYIILPDDSKHEQYVEGYGRSIGGTVDSSLRSEHCGVLALVVLISVIEKVYRVTESGCVKIYSDSMTVVQRINDPARRISYANTDYDLWTMTVSIINKMKTKVSLEHVKAHQDEKIGPLTLKQYYNVKADHLAKKGCYEDHLSNNVVVGLPVSVVIKGEPVTANIQETLYEHISGRPLRRYLMYKFEWEDDVYAMIDWVSFKSYTKTIPISKHANVIKYIYDWQYNKKWERRIVGNRNEQDQIGEPYKCPMKCGENEDHGHYLKCKKIINKPISEQLKEGIRTWLRKSLCEESMVKIIMTMISKYQLGETKLDGIMKEVEHTKYRKFVEQQNKIGLKNFLKCYISRELKKIQQDNYDRINDEREVNGEGRLSYKYTGEWWMKNLMRQIMYFALSHWQIRNDEEHKEKEKIEKQRYKMELTRRILEEYENKDEVGKEYQYLFDMAPLDRCMKPELNIEGWLNTVESCKSKNRERISTLMRYLKVK